MKKTISDRLDKLEEPVLKRGKDEAAASIIEEIEAAIAECSSPEAEAARAQKRQEQEQYRQETRELWHDNYCLDYWQWLERTGRRKPGFTERMAANSNYITDCMNSLVPGVTPLPYVYPGYPSKDMGESQEYIFEKY